MDPYLLVAAAEACAPTPLTALLDPDLDPARALVDPPAQVPPAARARLRHRDELEAIAARWLSDAAAAGLHVLTPASPHFPPRLLRAPLRPLVLFARGDLAALDAHARRSITIVGSRTPTSYGVAATRDFATACARAGLVIWSGLALGVDGIAHASAIAASTPTVAVLAGGLDAIYPRAHAGLADALLAGGGLWLSEAPPGLRATRGHFPRRNRILAVATEAVLVTEAGLASGTLHTAAFAGDAGTTVFAVPGAYTSPRSRGCHQLLVDGALLAVDPEDLLRNLDILAPPENTTDAGCSADAIALLRLVEVGPRPEDLLWRESRLERPAYARALLELTQKGLVELLAGGFVGRRLSR